MKIAPLVKAFNNYNDLNPERLIEHILVHTGRHQDVRMSESFFADLGIPPPDINLKIGSVSHAEQVGNTIIAIEKVLKDYKPDWVFCIIGNNVDRRRNEFKNTLRNGSMPFRPELWDGHTDERIVALFVNDYYEIN